MERFEHLELVVQENGGIVEDEAGERTKMSRIRYGRIERRKAIGV